MFRINGRKVFVKNGAHKQSINICSETNVHGKYDYIVHCRPARRHSERSLEALRFETVEALLEYLRGQPGCEVFLEPSRQRPAQPHPTQAGDLPRWEKLAISLVASAIDQLVLDFIEFPYLHRVEHSIHCELFRILKSHTLFATTYPMGGRQTQTVHKEWPRRGTSEGGNIDLCIHSPDDLLNCSYRDFREGHLRPAIGIEMGLDCKRPHLVKDEEKLIASQSRTCFLVHLVRDDVTDNFPAVERFLLESLCKTAYARIAVGRAFVKLIHDNEIRTIPANSAR